MKRHVSWALPCAVLVLAVPTAARAQISFEPESTEAAQKPETPSPAPKKVEGWSPPELAFRLNTRLSVDTAFEGHHENVAEWYRLATGSVKTHFGSLRLLLTARLRWVSVEEAPASGAFWLFNGT